MTPAAEAAELIFRTALILYHDESEFLNATTMPGQIPNPHGILTPNVLRSLSLDELLTCECKYIRLAVKTLIEEKRITG